MSNQELQNQSKKEDEGVNKRRRFIKGAGIAAPVVLTLASGSVFGAQCLSSRMSGNLSQHKPDDSCWGGQSPGWWKEYYNAPNGNGNAPPRLNTGKSCPFNDSKSVAWSKTGFSYGNYGDGTNNLMTGIGHDGTKLSATILSHISTDTRTLSQILLIENGSCLWHTICAMLNSYYAAAIGQHYIMTPAQFDGLITGSIPVPGGGSVCEFIKTFAEASYHDLADSNGTCS